MQDPSLFKIILAGDSNVGKSCLIYRFIEGAYNPELTNTIGIDFFNNKMQINGKTYKVQIWDTAGQERFKSMVKSYFRSASAAVLVFDLTKKQTFDNIESWLEQIREDIDPQAPIILVGNKSDLGEERFITEKGAREFASKLGMQYFEVSALSSENVEQLFRSAVEKAVQIYGDNQDKDKSFNTPVGPVINSKKDKNLPTGCCGL